MIRFIIVLTFTSLITMSFLVRSPSGDDKETLPAPTDSDIADVRNLPQEMGAYTSSLPDGYLRRPYLDHYLAEFRRKYYSPWTSDASITDFNAFVETMKEYLRKEWYGENRRRVPRRVMDELSANCDLEHLPSMKMPAIATITTDVRVLPTSRPFFANADDFPFDALQNTSIKLDEPVRILHLSRDRLWAFIETADTNGWVRSRDIVYVSKNRAKKWMNRQQVVIVKDFSLIRDKSGLADQRVKLGTICPLLGKHGDSYELIVMVNAGNNCAKELKAKVAKDSATPFPLDLNRVSVALIGNELIGKPYGWGENYQNRDCSAMIRDFYLPFGLWLPRGSYNQINYGKSISLAGLSNVEKERLIKEKGIPFFTLLYRKGHIMLYVGSRNDKVLVFHNTWGVNVRDGNGGEFKQIIGKAIVSTLNPGAELGLPDGPLLEKITNMLVLGER